MNNLMKTQALRTWYELSNQPEFRMNAEEHYEALLQLADDFEDQGLISARERGELIEKATALYAMAVEAVSLGR